MYNKPIKYTQNLSKIQDEFGRVGFSFSPQGNVFFGDMLVTKDNIGKMPLLKYKHKGGVYFKTSKHSRFAIHKNDKSKITYTNLKSKSKDGKDNKVQQG